MHSTFTTSHNALLARLAKLKPGEISNYPTTDEVLNVRDYVLKLAAEVDAHLAEVFAEAKFMAGVASPLCTTPLKSWINDESVENDFNSAAVQFAREAA